MAVWRGYKEVVYLVDGKVVYSVVQKDFSKVATKDIVRVALTAGLKVDDLVE